ncbi:hypothetical protein [Specibacter sp. NPDC078709]
MTGHRDVRVIASAERSGEHWSIEVPELDGAFTSAKRLGQVQPDWGWALQ